MSQGPEARWLKLSSNRSLVLDILHYDQRMPQCAHDRRFDLGETDAVRRSAGQRISWPAIFMKAYGLLSVERPVLRQCFFRFPWRHLYQHPESVGTIVVSRRHMNEDRLCWGRVSRPESYSLASLQQRLDRFKTEPVETMYRRQLQISRLPTPLRRLLWWTTMNISGRKRASRLGTFGMSTLAGQGAEIQQPPSVLASTLTYGPMDENGKARVTIVYDHRIMDGSTVASCLADLESIIRGAIKDELASLRSAPIANAPAAKAA